MGRFSGVAAGIANVADKLRKEREMGLEVGAKQQLLGSEEASKMRLLEKEASLKPTTESIVSDTGEVVGTRPVGSVFQPRPDPTEAIIAALGGTVSKPNIPQKTEERVNVISPDGQRGSIPKSQLQEALKNGYKRTIK